MHDSFTRADSCTFVSSSKVRNRNVAMGTSEYVGGFLLEAFSYRYLLYFLSDMRTSVFQKLIFCVKRFSFVLQHKASIVQQNMKVNFSDTSYE